MKTFTTHSEDETIALGSEFSRELRGGDTVALSGDLGSGKTRFIKGICSGLGVTEHVASPTFTLINEYRAGDLAVYHFDFYRLKSVQEIIALGFEEYVTGDGICLIEWAEKASPLLPGTRYSVGFRLGPESNTREIAIEKLTAVEA